MNMQDLLDFAIAHELGHALCNEKDEAKANRVAQMLREQKPFACEFKLTSRARSR
jgi:Zn-dependent peptidase ImmA (M78 family)